MLVVKRDGTTESVKFDKITARVQKLCYGLDPAHVDPVKVAMKVIEGLYDGVSTTILDNLAAETAASLLPITQIMLCWHRELLYPIYIKTPQNRFLKPLRNYIII